LWNTSRCRIDRWESHYNDLGIGCSNLGLEAMGGSGLANRKFECRVQMDTSIYGSRIAGNNGNVETLMCYFQILKVLWSHEEPNDIHFKFLEDYQD
jgi:hypothetical protein